MRCMIEIVHEKFVCCKILVATKDPWEYNPSADTHGVPPASYELSTGLAEQPQPRKKAPVMTCSPYILLITAFQ